MARFDDPPVEYLRQCSSTSLRYFEMSKLEHAANLRRELTVLLDEMMEETALALLARWMLERRGSRSPGAAQAGEARGRGSRAARELLAGWLSATRQVESGSAAPSRRDAPVPPPKPGPDPEIPSRGTRDSAPSLPTGDHTPVSPAARRDAKRAECKGGRGRRTSLPPSADTP